MKSCKLFLLALLVLGLQPLLAQQTDSTSRPAPATDGAEYSQQTPREAMSRHLYYLRPETFQPELSADVIPTEAGSLEERIELATKIRNIFDAKGLYVNTELIPDVADYQDSASGHYQYIPFPKAFPDIYVARYGGKWYYSNSTIEVLPQLYEDTFPIGAETLQNLLPGIGQKRLLGLAVWKWLGLLLGLGIAYLAYRVLNVVFGELIKRVVPRFAKNGYLDPKLVPPVARPLSLLLVIIGLRTYLLPMLLLPIDVSNPLYRIASIAMSIAGVWFFYKLVDIVAGVFTSLASKTDTTMDDQLVPLLVRAAKLVIVVFGALFVLDNLDVDVTALLAGVSIGGLAIALAAQDTVKNFIGSISIFVDRPFTIGDFIATGDIVGTVVEVGVRTTRIRALDGAQLTVPNGDLANRVITNHSIRTYRRYATSITVTYATSPASMEEFVEGVRTIVQGHEKVQEGSATVQFHEMNSSSLDIFYAAVFNITDYGQWLAARQEIFLAIMKLAEKMEIDFAFPSTSVYIEQMPQAQIQG